MERVEGSPTVRAYLQQSLAPHWSDRIRVVSDPPVKRPGDDTGDWLVGHVDRAEVLVAERREELGRVDVVADRLG